MKRLLYLIIISLTLVGCTNRDKNINANVPTVTVTIEPFRYFVNQIAGDKVNVNVMVPVGNNPETYEPTARQMVALSKSILYFKVGRIGFEETWMKKLIQNAPDMKVIDTSVGIRPAKTEGGVIDPHTWMSISNARIIARNIYQALCRQQPKDSSEFKRNYALFVKRLNSLEKQIALLMDKSAHSHVESFVIYHPALTYFARDYGITQLPIEEEGREPSIAQIQALIDKAKREAITTVFIQKEFANRNTQTFLNATHTQPIEINPLRYDWDSEMIYIAKKLSNK